MELQNLYPNQLFEKALLYATQKHATQTRKATNLPYILHPLAVASIVLEAGGSYQEASAALLHDIIEDQGGEAAYQEILSQFGIRVASIVSECTDAWGSPKPPWKDRKLQSIENLKIASSSALLVLAADKLHNLRSILAEYPSVKESLWTKFKGGKEGTLWYYNTTLKALQNKIPSYLFLQLEKAVQELNQLSFIDSSSPLVGESGRNQDSSSRGGNAAILAESWLPLTPINLPSDQQLVDIYLKANERVTDLIYYAKDQIFDDDFGSCISVSEVSHWRPTENDRPSALSLQELFEIQKAKDLEELSHSSKSLDDILPFGENNHWGKK
jgi:hypothetical protein